MEESNLYKYYCELYPDTLPLPKVCFRNGDCHYVVFESNNVTIKLSVDLTELENKMVKYICIRNTLEEESRLCGNFLDDKDYGKLKKMFIF